VPHTACEPVTQSSIETLDVGANSSLGHPTKGPSSPHDVNSIRIVNDVCATSFRPILDQADANSSGAVNGALNCRLRKVSPLASDEQQYRREREEM
jgi:hypothetical protein